MKNNITSNFVSFTSNFSNINGIKNYSSEKYISDGNIAKIFKNNNGKKYISYISPKKIKPTSHYNILNDVIDKNINNFYTSPSKELFFRNDIRNKNILYNQEILKCLMILIFAALIFICFRLTYYKIY